MFRAYGVPAFLRNRNKLRLLQSMEPMSDAVSRKLQESKEKERRYIKFYRYFLCPNSELSLTVCSYHVTYVFISESTLYGCLNVDYRMWIHSPTIECGFSM